jgi:antirestriction protein
MPYVETLDIRSLASEWRDLLDDAAALDKADRESSELADTVEEMQKYNALCDELGVEHDPDSLEYFGENYEPILIRESDFVEYAQELAEELGAMPLSSGGRPEWPLYCIDWEYAAKELAYDYTTVTFDGVDYKIRSW